MWSNRPTYARLDSPAEGTLGKQEIWWRNHYNWLYDRGYRLRSRYHPSWVPSWTMAEKKPHSLIKYEDSWNFAVCENINDAIQLSDGRHVVLKRISRNREPEELKILQYFNQEELSSHPQNHCVPLLNTLQTPEGEFDIAVMPLLRDYDDPAFDTVGEVVDFVRQILEGFAFLHEHRVAHKDVKGENILMNAVGLGIPDFHFCFQRFSADGKKQISPTHYRTERWPKYYLIDFGFSSQYSPDELPPMELPRLATDRSLPELEDRKTPCNPFPIDVYYVGNMIRMEILDGHEDNPVRGGYHGLEFLRPLVDAMIKRVPEERISMAEALARLEDVVSSLPESELRAFPHPLTLGNRNPPEGWSIKKLFHWIRRIIYIVFGFTPVPETAEVNNHV